MEWLGGMRWRGAGYLGSRERVEASEEESRPESDDGDEEDDRRKRGSSGVAGRFEA
jgi:hypothetical protein